MGSEGYKHSVPGDSTPAEEIARLRAQMEAKRAVREGVPPPPPEEDFVDTDSGAEKISLGTERVSISDFKKISLVTKSGNTYILRREEGVYTLLNVRAKKLIELDFAQIAELNLVLGKPFVYGKNARGENIQTAVVISGEGTLLKK